MELQSNCNCNRIHLYVIGNRSAGQLGLANLVACLSQCEGQMFLDIMDDHGVEQMIPFPTRDRNTLDLIVTSLPYFRIFTLQTNLVIMTLFQDF